jgi:hypothetical protein
MADDGRGRRPSLATRAHATRSESMNQENQLLPQNFNVLLETSFDFGKVTYYGVLCRLFQRRLPCVFPEAKSRNNSW